MHDHFMNLSFCSPNPDNRGYRDFRCGGNLSQVAMSSLSPDERLQAGNEGRKEMFYLTTHSTHFILRLYGIRHMVTDHSDSERGNLLPPHGLLFSINSKGSFICTIPQTGYYWLERAGYEGHVLLMHPKQPMFIWRRAFSKGPL